jgi:hypothetical protein
MERLGGLRAEMDPSSFDPMNVRENVKKILDTENIRDRGFNTAVNSITSILDNARMGYQHIENFKNAREALIREYEEKDPSALPDERFEIRLRYFDHAQLLEDRRSYDAQMKSFGTEVKRLWDMIEFICRGSRFRVRDFAELFRGRREKLHEKAGDSAPPDAAWDEISFLKSGETDVEKYNPTYVYEKDRLERAFPLMRRRLKEAYLCRSPEKRQIIEARLDMVENEYRRFQYGINPYHLQPGLLVDLDITSIKRKKTTLDAMAGVLGEFLRSVSRGFQDAALVSAGRGRGAGPSFDASPGGASPAPAYLDLINSGPLSEPGRAGDPGKAKVSRRGRKPKDRGGINLEEI